MPKKTEVDKYIVAHYRWLSLSEAASYCRCSLQEFYEKFYERIPKSLPEKSRKQRYDKHHLDLIMERDKVHPTKTYPDLNTSL
jgi:hypothetical protein